MWNLQTSVEKLKSCSSQTAHRVQSSKMARLLHKPNCGRSLVSILFTSNVSLHELTPEFAEMLPRMDSSWKFDTDLPKISVSEEYASY